MAKTQLLLLLTASFVFASAASAGIQPTLEQRLEKLAATLETARIDAHIPGMSIRSSRTMKSSGLADVASQTPADENTIYAVGSTTKAFTATLVGIQVDEGNASWDDPVTEFLPYFDLQVRSETEDAECTLRDLLSHRHGFTRMGILLIGGKASREEVLRTAAGAEPLSDFGKAYHYSNISYLAAGEAAGVAAGSSWDDLMKDRIFKPLKMTSSTLTVPEAQEDPRLAIGYQWVSDLEQLEHIELYDLGIIAPAGAVNSNVMDMAQWIRLQLGRGEIGGRRLVSAERILDTWEPQIEMAPGRSYGLGWMLREHGGRKVVEHGGATFGFSAQVGLMPEENLGFVLLMNLNNSPLREPSLELVFDALLDEWPSERADENPAGGDIADAEAIDLDEYIGTYIANFSRFRDAEFEIQINENHLVLDMAGRNKTGLEHPDAEGIWNSTVSDQLAVSFDRDDQGSVIGLRIHNSGFQFEVPRKGIEIKAEVPAETLEKYVGAYIRAQGGKRVQISIERGHLAMDNRGMMLLFNTPDAEGHASLRARDHQGATFKLDAEGIAESFIFHGNAGDRLFTRLADSTQSVLPTLEELLALRHTDERVAAMNAAGGTKISGKVWVRQAGLHGTVTIYTQGSDRYANHMEFGIFGRISEGVHDKKAWAYTALRGLRVLEGDELTQAILEHPGAVEGDWGDYFDSAEVIGSDTVNGRPAHIVRLKKGDLPSRTYRIDAEHGDVVRVNQISIEAWGPVSITATYSDFQEVDGIRRPMRVEILIQSSGTTVFTFEQYEPGLELGDEVFILQDPDAD